MHRRYLEKKEKSHDVLDFNGRKGGRRKGNRFDETKTLTIK